MCSHLEGAAERPQCVCGGGSNVHIIRVLSSVYLNMWSQILIYMLCVVTWNIFHCFKFVFFKHFNTFPSFSVSSCIMFGFSFSSMITSTTRKVLVKLLYKRIVLKSHYWKLLTYCWKTIPTRFSSQVKGDDPGSSSDEEDGTETNCIDRSAGKRRRAKQGSDGSTICEEGCMLTLPWVLMMKISLHI